MPDWTTDPSGYEDDAPPSKSARKRQMHALQALGESLVNLSDRQLAAIPIENEQLSQAIADCRQIGSNSARKRQLQYIGKLMRGIDPAPIEQALQNLHAAGRRDAQAFHLLEHLRDAILTDGDSGVETVLQRWPEADRQQLRQLALQHEREKQRGKPPAASRKLFSYLRELQSLYGDND